jgi:hypothetical protein
MSTRTKTLCVAAVAALAAVLCSLANAEQKDQAHFTLDDADEMARRQLMKSLGGADQQASSKAVPSATAPAPVRSAARQQPAPEPATFVGAILDQGRVTVLYQYLSGIYQAKVGSTLLNGWSVTAVHDFQVTLSYRGRTWTAPIVSPTGSENSPRSPLLGALSSLASPLPVAVPVAPVQVPPPSNPTVPSASSGDN